jgi:DNA polymerase IV
MEPDGGTTNIRNVRSKHWTPWLGVEIRCVVRPNRIRKSVGAENTFFADLTEFEAMVAELQPLIDKVWQHCEDKGTRGRTVTLKVKFADFELISRSRTLAGAICSHSELKSVSAEMLKALFPLLGVSISSFEQAKEPEQTSLAL